MQDTIVFLLATARYACNSSSTDNSNGNDPSPASATLSTGIPCLCKLLTYLISVIKQAAPEGPSSAEGGGASNGGKAAAASGSDGWTSTSKSTLQAGNNPNGLLRHVNQHHVPFQPALDETSFDADTLHLLFALKTVLAVLSAGGDADIIRVLIIR